MMFYKSENWALESFSVHVRPHLMEVVLIWLMIICWRVAKLGIVIQFGNGDEE